MKSQVSPKQLARAIQVSESSVKRWCDQGRIDTFRTAGGHRRIPLTHVLRFLRDHSYELVRPEVLGLPASMGEKGSDLDHACSRFRQALLNGDDTGAHSTIFELFIAHDDPTVLMDRVMAPALHEIGDLWMVGAAQVYQERRACEICLRILHELRQVIPPPNESAWLAIGGTPECDPYYVPNAMVDLTLRWAGWQTNPLGVALPFETLRSAIEHTRPRLLWLSVSHIDDEERFVREYERFYQATPAGVAIVVGGQALTEGVRQQMQYASFCDNLRHLETFAKSLASPAVNGKQVGGDREMPLGANVAKAKGDCPLTGRQRPDDCEDERSAENHAPTR